MIFIYTRFTLAGQVSFYGSRHVTVIVTLFDVTVTSL